MQGREPGFSGNGAVKGGVFDQAVESDHGIDLVLGRRAVQRGLADQHIIVVEHIVLGFIHLEPIITDTGINGQDLVGPELMFGPEGTGVGGVIIVGNHHPGIHGYLFYNAKRYVPGDNRPGRNRKTGTYPGYCLCMCFWR